MKNETKTIIMFCALTALVVFIALAIVGYNMEKQDQITYSDGSPRDAYISACMGVLPNYNFCACGADVTIREINKGGSTYDEMVDMAASECRYLVK